MLCRKNKNCNFSNFCLNSTISIKKCFYQLSIYYRAELFDELHFRQITFYHLKMLRKVKCSLALKRFILNCQIKINRIFWPNYFRKNFRIIFLDTTPSGVNSERVGFVPFFPNPKFRNLWNFKGPLTI